MIDRYLAAIDIGTNSFHMIIVKILEDDSFRIIDREREVIRLVSDTWGETNRIDEAKVNKAVKALIKFKKIAIFYNAEIRAVATSAVREADNKDYFIKKIFDETKIVIHAIKGSDEAKLIYKGMSHALPIRNRTALCIDIGGGSTEFILAKKDKIIFAESVKVGAVRLSKRFFPKFELDVKAIIECRAHVKKLVLGNKNLAGKVKFDAAIGSSGTIESAAEMIISSQKRRELKSLNSFVYSREELDLIAGEILKRKTMAERMKVKGLEQKRADIIPAGIIILQTIFEIFKIESLMISEYALREGIIFEYISNNFGFG